MMKISSSSALRSKRMQSEHKITIIQKESGKNSLSFSATIFLPFFLGIVNKKKIRRKEEKLA